MPSYAFFMQTHESGSRSSSQTLQSAPQSLPKSLGEVGDQAGLPKKNEHEGTAKEDQTVMF